MASTALCARELLGEPLDITLLMIWSPALSLLQASLSLKSPRVCSGQMASGRMASHLFPGRAAKRCAGTSQWHVHWLTHISVQPLESQARPQRLPLPARRRSTLILMVGTFLNRSPLAHSAYSTHQLASSCVISVGKFLSRRWKWEKRAFCFKDVRCSCNVSMPYYFTTVYLPLTAPADWSYPFCIICDF